MTNAKSERVYHRLVVNATNPGTDLWLADEHWYLVQKATSLLDTSVLPGRYFIEFGPADAAGLAYPIELARDLLLTERELESGPSCQRRPPDLLEDEPEGN